jgi:hypothetical protein
MKGIETTVLTLFLYLFVSVRSYSLDNNSFQFCSTFNPDCSICMGCCDSPWLVAVWAFCFAEDTILFHQNLISSLVIIIHLHAVFACCVKISLALHEIFNFVPVSYEWNAKEHVASKYCCAWRGFKDLVIDRANGPCRVVKEDVHIIGGY